MADMGFPGIIENTFGSELNVINCLFTDNKYGQEDNPSVSMKLGFANNFDLIDYLLIKNISSPRSPLDMPFEALGP